MIQLYEIAKKHIVKTIYLNKCRVRVLCIPYAQINKQNNVIYIPSWCENYNENYVSWFSMHMLGHYLGLDCEQNKADFNKWLLSNGNHSWLEFEEHYAPCKKTTCASSLERQLENIPYTDLMP